MNPVESFRFHFIQERRDHYIDAHLTDSQTVEKKSVFKMGGHTYTLSGPLENQELVGQKLLALPLTHVKTFDQLREQVHTTFGSQADVQLLLYKSHTVGLQKLAASATESASQFPIDKIEKYLKKLQHHPFFSGYVVVTYGKETLLEQAFMPKGVTQTTSIGKETPFNIMSVGKLFTAVAVMQLIEQNKLALDDPIKNYLTSSDLELQGADDIYVQDMKGLQETVPHLENFLSNEKITIRHLLTHTAGLMKKNEKESPQAYEESRVEEKHYSNYGYQLLARIIQNVSKKESFTDYIKEVIFRQAGMQGAIKCLDEPVKTEPQPFNTSLGEMIPINPKKEKHYHLPGPDGNGCWWMTAQDLVLFAQALEKNTLISEETKKLMLTPQISTSLTSFQGLGFGIENAHPLVIGHPGSFTGRAAALVVAEGPQPLTIVCLSNTNQGANVAGEIIELIKGNTINTPLLNSDIQKNIHLYKELKSLDAGAKLRIQTIIKESQAPSFIIQLIADKIENEGNQKLADVIRRG